MDDPSLFNQPVTIQYRIRTGTTAIGIMSSGSVQYKEIDIWQLNPPFSPTNPPDWEDWYSDQYLTRYGCMLYDTKGLTAGQIAGMSQVTVGYTFLRFTQPMRYVWQTPYDNEWFSSSLGSIGMEVYKYDSEQWAIKEQ